MANAKSPSTNPTRIIKQPICKLFFPTAKGQLTYNIGHNDQSKSLHIRVIANTGGGFFGNEWIGLDDVLACIEEQTAAEPFKAIIFRKLNVPSKSSNNHGFLAAALRTEGILLPVEKAEYSHTLFDTAALTKAMQKPIEGNVSLEDKVAIHNAEMEARRRLWRRKCEKLGMVRQLPKIHPRLSKFSSMVGFTSHPARSTFH